MGRDISVGVGGGGDVLVGGGGGALVGGGGGGDGVSVGDNGVEVGNTTARVGVVVGEGVAVVVGVVSGSQKLKVGEGVMA